MRCGRWAKVTKFCLYALGLGNLVLLVLGEPTILPLVLAVVLAPLSLALALKLMAELRPIRTDLLRPIQIDLLKNAPRTILASWVRLPRLRWKPARNTVVSSTERPGS
jgi:hypothetical protein